VDIRVFVVRLGGVQTITSKAKSPPPHATAPTIPTALVRAETVASYLSVNRRSVERWASIGTIPCVRVAGSLRFDLAKVLAAIEGGQP
jgi:excisionase family DNA binding protein